MKNKNRLIAHKNRETNVNKIEIIDLICEYAKELHIFVKICKFCVDFYTFCFDFGFVHFYESLKARALRRAFLLPAPLNHCRELGEM